MDVPSDRVVEVQIHFYSKVFQDGTGGINFIVGRKVQGVREKDEIKRGYVNKERLRDI